MDQRPLKRAIYRRRFEEKSCVKYTNMERICEARNGMDGSAPRSILRARHGLINLTAALWTGGTAGGVNGDRLGEMLAMSASRALPLDGVWLF